MGRKLPQLSEVKWSPNEFSELIDLASGIHNLFHDLCLYRNYNTDQPRRLAAIRRTIPAPYSWPAAQGLARIADSHRSPMTEHGHSMRATATQGYRSGLYRQNSFNQCSQKSCEAGIWIKGRKSIGYQLKIRGLTRIGIVNETVVVMMVCILFRVIATKGNIVTPKAGRITEPNQVIP